MKALNPFHSFFNRHHLFPLERQWDFFTDARGRWGRPWTGTFASIINNNVNVVMKLLTSVTILIALPTMIASIYGMNIPLPLQGYPFAFFAVMGTALGLSAFGLFILIRWKVL